MQWSSTCFNVFDYGNPVGLCVERMRTDENLQFSKQKLRLKLVTIPVKNRVSSAGMSIAQRTGHRRNCRSILGRGKRFFLLQIVQNRSGTQLIPRAVSYLAKRPRRADHSPPRSAEVPNARSYTSTSGRGVILRFKCHVNN